jgi:hypothetical protein
VKPKRISHNNLKYHRIDASLREQKRQSWNKPVLWPVATLLIVLLVGLVPAIVSYRRKERGIGIEYSRERGKNA